jgi:hypothetical protein
MAGLVMAGLVPAIHAAAQSIRLADFDGAVDAKLR